MQISREPWQAHILKWFLVLVVVAATSVTAVAAPDSGVGGGDWCPVIMGCQPDVVTSNGSSYTHVVGTEGDDPLTLFLLPGPKLDSLRVSLTLAKLDNMPDGVDTLPEHLWQGVKNWLFSGPLETVRDGAGRLVATIKSTVSELTEGVHTEDVPVARLSLGDSCRWHTLVVEAVRVEESTPSLWAVRVWVDGAPHLFPTKYWWSVNWVLRLDVSARGSARWVTTRDTPCPTPSWLAAVVAAIVVLLLVALVCGIVRVCGCATLRQRLRHCWAGPCARGRGVDGAAAGDVAEPAEIGTQTRQQVTILGVSRTVTSSTKRWVFFKVSRGAPPAADDSHGSIIS